VFYYNYNPKCLPSYFFLNPLKPKLLLILKHPVLTSKKTQPITITKINWLTLFKEIIAVYSENHRQPRQIHFVDKTLNNLLLKQVALIVITRI
jgi:hypothetical protein